MPLTGSALCDPLPGERTTPFILASTKESAMTRILRVLIPGTTRLANADLDC